MKNLKYHFSGFILLCLSFFLFQGFISTVPEREITLQVKPVFGDKKLLLETTKYLTPNGDTISVSRLRFYLSAIRFTFSDGSVYNEQNSYHLLDAEDTSTLQINLKLVPQKEIASIQFNIGVDSLASVSGALDGDLDPVKGMYWAWNSGYINAKLEGKCTAAENKEFEFHVGGYLPPHTAIRKVSIDMNKQDIQAGNIIIAADVMAWFKNIELSKTSRIVMPGADAMKIADNYMEMFRIDK